MFLSVLSKNAYFERKDKYNLDFFLLYYVKLSKNRQLYTGYHDSMAAANIIYVARTRQQSDRHIPYRR